jgi:tRNA uridine 5-carboxymethylaminomethyl modification enzyme
VDDVRWDAFCRKRDLVSRETQRLAGTRVRLSRTGERTVGSSLLDLLRRPEVRFDDLPSAEDSAGAVSRETLRRDNGRLLADQAIEQIEISARYAGYVTKQDAEVERSARADATPLPGDFDFASVRALSFEVRQVLERSRPASLGAAARLPGVTPAAVSLLMVHLKRHRRAAAAERDGHVPRTDA